MEHLQYNDLDQFKKILFQFMRPKLVIITTPNIEFNIYFKNL